MLAKLDFLAEKYAELNEKISDPEIIGDQMNRQTIGISHADNPELVDLFVKMAGKRFNTDRFKIVPLGSTVLTHSGPGTLAVFFFDEWQEAYRFE